MRMSHVMHACSGEGSAFIMISKPMSLTEVDNNLLTPDSTEVLSFLG